MGGTLWRQPAGLIVVAGVASGAGDLILIPVRYPITFVKGVNRLNLMMILIRSAYSKLSLNNVRLGRPIRIPSTLAHPASRGRQGPELAPPHAQHNKPCPKPARATMV